MSGGQWVLRQVGVCCRKRPRIDKKSKHYTILNLAPFALSNTVLLSSTTMRFYSLTLIVIALAGFTLWMASCSLLDPAEVSALPRASSTDTAAKKPAESSVGTIRSISVLDNRSWVVEGEDGHLFDPANLPDSLKQEGARIRFSYKPLNSWGYTYLSGDLIELTQVAAFR